MSVEMDCLLGQRQPMCVRCFLLGSGGIRLFYF